MDICGYNNNGPNNLFPYDPSNELPQQLLKQQPLSNAMAFNREPHNMPVPSGSPWNPEALPWGMPSPPQLVEFTGQTLPGGMLIPQTMPMSALMPTLPNFPGQNFPPTVQTISLSNHQPTVSMPCKRKSLDPEPVIPPKQLITEEKMAAHLSGLHISSNYKDYTSFNPNWSFNQDCVDMTQDTDVPILEKLKGHTIILSDELKKLKEEPLLPPSLIERLEKPCMSLVVWKPKEEIITKAKDSESEEKDEESNKRKNGLLVPEFAPSGMDVEM